MDQALSSWIEAHPYLLPIARVQEIVARAAAAPGGSAPLAARPDFDAYAAEHARGVPLLRSESFTPDLGPAVEAFDRIVNALADAPDVAHVLKAAARDLRERLGECRESRLEALRWVIAGAPEDRAPAEAGVVRFVGWSALRAALAPVLAAYETWRGNGDAWLQGHCPACGSLPSVSRLSPGEVMRQRSLLCSCCGSEWRFRRIGCPHCGNDVSDRITVFEAEGDEAGLRIDACEECKGYVKTYAGDDPRAPALADWATLHLDLLAKDRGYRRVGASLHEV